jgi:hypothetical protein
MLVFEIARRCCYRRTIEMAGRSEPQQTVYRWQRVHPALHVGHVLTVKSKRQEPMKVFFQQSELDGACGIHCVSMALVILGLAKSYALTEMSRRKYGVPADVWREFSDVYFCGIEVEEFVERIRRLGLPIDVAFRTSSDASLDQFAVDNLMRGELVALAFKSVNNRRTNHWALGVGCEGDQIGRESHTDTLLMLDPSAPEHSFRAFSARLRLPESRVRISKPKAGKSTKPINWQYDSTDWQPEPVRLIGAVRFRLGD